MATRNSDGSERGADLVIDANGSEKITLPDGLQPATADFSRSGHDIVLEFGDGKTVVIRDYFAQEPLADIESVTGAKIEGALASRLAGPLAPGQVAQAGGTDAEAQPIGRVESSEGEVYAIRLDGTQVELKAGDPIYQGDQLETGGDGAVGIVFVDDTTFSLGADGTMVLDELIYDPNTESGSSSFSLVQGVFSFVSGKISKTGVDAMQVKTPVATIGIRGTKGGIDLGDGQTLTVVLTQESDGQVGEIAVYNDAGVQILNQPFQATQVLGINVPPVQTFTVSAQQFEQTFAPALRSLPQNTFDAGNAGNENDQQAGPDAPEDEAGPPVPEEAMEGEETPEEAEEGEGEEVALEEAAGPPVLEGELEGEGEAFGPDLSGAPEEGDIDVVTGGDYVGNQGIETVGGVDVGSISAGDSSAGMQDGDNSIIGGIVEQEVVQTVFGPVNGTFTGSTTGETIFGGAGSDTLDGGGGSDLVLGGGGGDVVIGGLGNDILTGDAGNDYVSGGTGGDTIIGGTGLGDDTYDGGEGDDWVFYMSANTGITVDLSNDMAFGAANEIGTDTLISIENIIGGAGSDTIIGGDEANTLDGYSGDDTIFGGAGDDLLIDRGGNDTYSGGAGNDKLLVGLATTAAEPTISGNVVGSRVFNLGAGAGSNEFSGGDGSDTLSFELYSTGVTVELNASGSVGTVSNGTATYALPESDLIYLSAGADSVTQVSGNDSIGFYLDAGAGNDSIQSADGADTLIGGAGDDVIDGGGGSDSIYGGLGNDSLVGGAGDDHLRGQAGVDTLSGGLGNDTLEGGTGSDVLQISEGHDLIILGDGAGATGDAVMITGSFGLLSAYKAGDDIIFLSNSGSTDVHSLRVLNHFSNYSVTSLIYEDNGVTGQYFFSSSPSADFGAGSSGDDFLFTSGPAAAISGGAGNDLLLGAMGADTLVGGVGNDVLIGGGGGDTLDGGAGFDAVSFEAEGNGVSVDLSTGTTIVTGGGDAADTLISIESVTGSNFDDILTGSSAANILSGKVGNDTIDGGAGADTLFGGEGNDLFISDAGNDTLFGDAGSDTLSYSNQSAAVFVDLANGTATGSAGCKEI